MEFLDTIKQRIPDYAKDIRLNLDSVITRSSLALASAIGVALAASFAAKSKFLVDAFKASLPDAEANGALTAAATMGMNNIWYPFREMADDEHLKVMPAELRMNAYTTSGGIDRKNFEAYALAASIVGKCRFCVKSHCWQLKEAGFTTQQLRDIGRIAAVVNATALVINAGDVAEGR